MQLGAVTAPDVCISAFATLYQSQTLPDAICFPAVQPSLAPKPAMRPGERTYTFIADPTHKENLSGRVTAACLNCRRKKIKCSGRANCRQCQEKGLVCEDPPQRKRPKRDHASPGSSSADKKAGLPAKPDIDSQTGREAPPVSLPHNDSGYGSARHPSLSSHTPSTSASPVAGSEVAASDAGSASTRTEQWRTQAPQAMHSSDDVASGGLPASSFSFDVNYGRRSSVHVSPTTRRSSEIFGAPNPHPNTALSNPPPFPGYSAFGPMNQPFAPQGPTTARYAEQSLRGGHNEGVWPGGRTDGRSPIELIQAAEALEQQAQSLRRLADEGDEYPPIDPTQTLPSPDPRRTTDYSTASGRGLMGADTAQPPFQYETTTFFRPDGTAYTGPPSMPSNVAEWWASSAQRDGVQAMPGPLEHRTRMQNTFLDQLARSDRTDESEEQGGGRQYQYHPPR